MTGEVQFSFDSAQPAIPAIENGSVQGLAVTSDQRIPQLPNLPTMIEAGVPDFVSVSFTGIAAPAGTPPDVVQKLNAAINQALQSDQVKPVLNRLAVEAQMSSADEFAAFLNKEREQWSAVVKHADIHASE
jgi:tripartite-type tricarboxylate transporter receptor subunit TctC